MEEDWRHCPALEVKGMGENAASSSASCEPCRRRRLRPVPRTPFWRAGLLALITLPATCLAGRATPAFLSQVRRPVIAPQAPRLGRSPAVVPSVQQQQQQQVQKRWQADHRVTTRLESGAITPLRAIAEREVVARLLMATLAGSCIGFERRYSERPAGIRTMALVSLGACIFTMISVYGLSGDQSRIAANVASGVGFIGAGVISQTSVKEGPKQGVRQINGLTTATAIWVSAALGVSSGAGLHTLTISGAALAVMVLRMGRILRIIRVHFADIVRRFMHGRPSLLFKRNKPGPSSSAAKASSSSPKPPTSPKPPAEVWGPSPIQTGVPSVSDLYATTDTLGLGSRDPANSPSRYDATLAGGGGGGGAGGFSIVVPPPDDSRPDSVGLSIGMGSVE